MLRSHTPTLLEGPIDPDRPLLDFPDSTGLNQSCREYPEESDAPSVPGKNLAHNLRPGLSEHEVFLSVARQHQSYVSQFRYVCQWRLWGAEALDVFFLDRVVSPSDPWPWWLRYNPAWLLAYTLLSVSFSSGCLLHCLLYQGYPVPHETPEERRFRIHYVYGFDAYLGLCGWIFLGWLFLFEDDRRHVAAEGILLTVLWILGNSLALLSMYKQSNTGIRCFVAGQLAWTLVLTGMNVFDLVKNFSLVAVYHSVVVLFFWICVFFYLVPYGPSEGLWGLYARRRELNPWLHWAAISATVLVVMLVSLLVLYIAGDLLWYIISGTHARSEDLSPGT
mmetsp:Transcript_707/g.1687  ORF Transcript_707/g.1687 Transcript_707/m.1687 type:complete len:334 (-) Transcript_707:528-1529(-)